MHLLQFNSYQFAFGHKGNQKINTMHLPAHKTIREKNKMMQSAKKQIQKQIKTNKKCCRPKGTQRTNTMLPSAKKEIKQEARCCCLPKWKTMDKHKKTIGKP